MRLFEEFITILAVLAGFTQVILPIVLSRPMFPVFRKSERDKELAEARAKLAETEKKLDLARIEAATARMDKQAEDLNTSETETPTGDSNDTSTDS